MCETGMTSLGAGRSLCSLPQVWKGHDVYGLQYSSLTKVVLTSLLNDDY